MKPKWKSRKTVVFGLTFCRDIVLSRLVMFFAVFNHITEVEFCYLDFRNCLQGYLAYIRIGIINKVMINVSVSTFFYCKQTAVVM